MALACAYNWLAQREKVALYLFGPVDMMWLVIGQRQTGCRAASYVTLSLVWYCIHGILCQGSQMSISGQTDHTHLEA